MRCHSAPLFLHGAPMLPVQVQAVGVRDHLIPCDPLTVAGSKGSFDPLTSSRGGRLSGGATNEHDGLNGAGAPWDRAATRTRHVQQECDTQAERDDRAPLGEVSLGIYAHWSRLI